MVFVLLIILFFCSGWGIIINGNIVLVGGFICIICELKVGKFFGVGGFSCFEGLILLVVYFVWIW